MIRWSIGIFLALLVIAYFVGVGIASYDMAMDMDDTIAVTRQSGFSIEVDSDLMKSACKCHGIGEQDIRWDTVNNNFVFIMKNGKTGYVFTEFFRQSKAYAEYLEIRDEQ